MTVPAMGCHAEALALAPDRRGAPSRLHDLGALTVLEAGRGEVPEAERLFTAARRHLPRGLPFPLAELDLRRGLMWLAERDLPAAGAWFDAAVRRVPAYAPAVGHLAEVDAALGDLVGRHLPPRPLAVSSDDLEYAATLAGVLGNVGQSLEAEHGAAAAAARYDELVLHHPEAFVDHAAGFWLTVGGDPQRGLRVG